jgi:hypothetical protein
MFHKVETKLLTTSPSQRQFQWGGGINDAGTMIWTAPANPSSPVWYVFAATWVPAPVLTVVQTPGLALEWPTNAGRLAAIQRQPDHQRGKLHQTIGQPAGSAAFFRLSTGSP